MKAKFIRSGGDARFFSMVFTIGVILQQEGPCCAASSYSFCSFCGIYSPRPRPENCSVFSVRERRSTNLDAHLQPELPIYHSATFRPACAVLIFQAMTSRPRHRSPLLVASRGQVAI